MYSQIKVILVDKYIDFCCFNLYIKLICSSVLSLCVLDFEYMRSTVGNQKLGFYVVSSLG